jgi:transposase InsO family protein
VRAQVAERGLTEGKQASGCQRRSIAENALYRLKQLFGDRAFWRRQPEPGLRHHPDRGSHQASQQCREPLRVRKRQQRMSRKGNWWDNAPTERFFRSLKPNTLTMSCQR